PVTDAVVPICINMEQAANEVVKNAAAVFDRFRDQSGMVFVENTALINRKGYFGYRPTLHWKFQAQIIQNAMALHADSSSYLSQNNTVPGRTIPQESDLGAEYHVIP